MERKIQIENIKKALELENNIINSIQKLNLTVLPHMDYRLLLFWL